MSVVTDYGLNYISGSFFGAQYAVPTSFWVALVTDLPDPSADGTMLLEPPTANGYARVQATNDVTVWGAPSGGVVSNVVTIFFPAVSTADWPAISGYVFCDAATGGNVYLAGRLRIPQVASVGTRLRFDPGALVLSANQPTQAIIPAS